MERAEEKIVKREAEAKGLKFSIAEGESKVITSCGYFVEKFQECSKKGVVLATSVETLELQLGTRTKQLGAEEKARRKKFDVRFSVIKKIRVFQKNTRLV